MTLQTPLCDRLDVEYPLVQAPIGSAASPELAAAVADAGGVGHVSVTWRSRDSSQQVVRRTADLTDGTFAVNLALDDRTTHLPTRDHLDAVLDAGAEVVSLSFGDPTPYVERVHDAGATLLATVGSADEAESAAAAGVDCVVAQGWEAGGHLQSDVATMPLVPRVADAVDVPVVAAGGIADGRGLAAALTLGADAAWVGTRFVATEEAAVADPYREMVADADETASVRTALFDRGWPGRDHRVLHNSTVETWAEAGRPASGARPGEGEIIGSYPGGRPIERYGFDMPVEGVEGDAEAMALYAGQSAGLTDDVVPAARVVEQFVSEAEAAAERVR